ncbi:MAG: hypothetical protein II979_04440 [Clostridia bacterium]|nr:hypothetical protein [Clostridia bacterium]
MNKMEEERKIRHCPDCGKEMEEGFLQIYRNATFHKKRIRFSTLLEEPDVHLTNDSLLNSECSYAGWHCKDCGMILFDYKDPRAGMGKSLFDAMADGIEVAFDALDKHFGGWTTEEENQKKWDSPAETAEDSTEKTQAEPEKPVPEEKPKKRIITSSGVREVDDE